MFSTVRWLLVLLLQTVLLPNFVLGDIPACTEMDTFDADFIVVGSGAGGGPLAARLTENGFHVLVIEAGNNTIGLNTTLPAYLGRATEDPKIDLGYMPQEFTADSPHRRISWYPRAQGIGGSTIHNAMINIIAGTRTDFDYIASLSNDSSWSRDSMQDYLKKIERNLYAPLSPDHGHTGWLSTSLLPYASLIDKLAILDPQLLTTFLSVTAISGQPLILDLNVPESDGAAGVNTPSFTIDADHIRSSVYNRLVDVQQLFPNLDILLNTLATKLDLCRDSTGNVVARGVEIARGASLPAWEEFSGKQNLTTEVVTAKYEVIVSAGVFQSPQLLMLSGIGDSQQLSKFGIETVVDLPGVGTNLHDHHEVSVIWRLKNNYTLYEGCKWLYDTDEDPCLAAWFSTGHLNAYSFAAALSAITTKTNDSLSAPNLMVYFTPSYFEGFVRGFAQQIVDNPNAFTAVALTAHPKSRGTVKLTGSHPQDLLAIEMAHFEGPGGQEDIDALVKGIELAREVVNHTLVEGFVEEEIFPGVDGDLTEHVFEHVFGHHACCTNPMGDDTDSDAVLDGQFRVRGVQNLRVVDMSSWRRVPGFFPTTPMYMVSEKVADMLMQAARTTR